MGWRGNAYHPVPQGHHGHDHNMAAVLCLSSNVRQPKEEVVFTSVSEASCKRRTGIRTLTSCLSFCGMNALIGLSYLLVKRWGRGRFEGVRERSFRERERGRFERERERARQRERETECVRVAYVRDVLWINDAGVGWTLPAWRPDHYQANLSHGTLSVSLCLTHFISLLSLL